MQRGLPSDHGIAMTAGLKRTYVGVTDNAWFRQLRSLAPEEVNFWQPGGSTVFRALAPGDLFLFKLHAPLNFVVGGGFFAHFSLLPCSLAWEAFGPKNGATSFLEMRRRIEKYRRTPPRPHEDYQIGCIILEAPFFFDESDWLPAPKDFARSIVRGKGYDLTTGTGAALRDAISLRIAASRHPIVRDSNLPMFGEPSLVRQRLGQGSFRVLITDIYERRCAVTRERVLPTLEAAHIQPVSEGGHHEVGNGLLLRSDVHRLFDAGYVTVTPDHRFRVSQRIKEDFHNGEEYYQLQGAELWLPRRADDRPAPTLLGWHNDSVFMG